MAFQVLRNGGKGEAEGRQRFVRNRVTSRVQPVRSGCLAQRGEAVYGARWPGRILVRGDW